MSASRYATLTTLTAEINRLACAGEWEAAARLTRQIESIQLPAPSPQDRQALEAALQNIADIVERAEPLKDDLGRLLKAFG